MYNLGFQVLRLGEALKRRHRSRVPKAAVGEYNGCMPETVKIFFTGLLLGASLIIAIGAQNAFVLRQGIKRSFVIPIVTLCTLIDMTLILLGTAGVGTLMGSYPFLTHLAAWGGAVFLLFYGGASFKSALRPQTLKTDPSPQETGRPESLRSVILITLGVSLLNPHVYLDTFVLIGGIAAQYQPAARPYFAAGASTASLVWFFGLGYGARLLAPLFQKPIAWRVLDVLIGLVMWSIAVSLIWGELKG